MEHEEFPILKYTVQLYYRPKSSYIDGPAPVQIASGVLIRNSSKCFLLTCKHVFDGIEINDVIIFTSMGYAVRLPDKAVFINDEKDSLDLALIHFSGHRLAELKSYYTFLPYRNLGFDHVFEEELFYMLYGYINKQTKLDENAFYAEPFGYLSTFRKYRKFEGLGFSYDNNVTLEYSRKQTYLTEDIRMLGYKELKGMSGGGIWLSVAGRRRNTFKYILVGILIEERLDRGFIIGTRIALLQNRLNDNTPHQP